MTKDSSPHRLAYLALVAVCLFWGTTYLGIRVALESFPPLYLIAIRYVISGSILLVASALGGATIPRGRELWQTAACGAICIGVGNGFLAIAELYVPSGLAALFYTLAPFWMIGIDSLLPQGKRPVLFTMFGLALGLAGVAFLVYPAAVREGFQGQELSGFFLIQISTVGWVLGALLQKRVKAQAQPFVSGAVQQLAAGLAVFVPAGLLEKLPHSVSMPSLLAVIYLVVFGSLVGFSAFIYTMAKLPVAIASLYTFVNPVVAMFLGWLLYREPFGSREFVAMLVIFAGIAVVRWSESRRVRSESVPLPASASEVRS